MSTLTPIPGGVCAPKGFKAAGICCGIRSNKTKNDLSLIVSDVPCSAAAVYTQNKVKGAPITVTKKNIADGKAQAVVCNSGNANTCNADGIEIAEKMCQIAAEATGLKADDFVIGSTGVIGQPLPIQPIADGMPKLAAALSYDGSDNAAWGIMTTDTVKKEYGVSFTVGGKTCSMGAIAKGSGMIHPNMATMLAFITTDAAISPAMLQKALSEDIVDTFNMVSVDGDTSTNDTVAILANGMAGNEEITSTGADYDAFVEALHYITVSLSRGIAGDGEGATKLLECRVTGAPDKQTARIVAKSVITSSLFKAAMFGEDANWGRVLCAIGYAPADFDINKVAVSLSSEKGEIAVCKDGSGVKFSEEKAAEVLSAKEIIISVTLGEGTGEAVAWGCDLTYDYVKINGDYRT